MSRMTLASLEARRINLSGIALRETLATLGVPEELFIEAYRAATAKAATTRRRSNKRELQARLERALAAIREAGIDFSE